ncbi:TRAP transporter small permease subunit [Catenovulum sediminis]|uniref:TRAP transporter small permease protein n=1 Tax=Catenovulum sediminis TaxID=1740262 RepID=A0ABV1RL27_9ALTE|nr:TRAP transporter small permease subunit [Catenovulum sediminis]
MNIIKIADSLECFAEKLGRCVSWFCPLIVLLMTAIVVLRYGFSFGSIAMQEIVLYFHSAIFLLGAGYTLKHNEHVRVDVFYHRFSVVTKAWVSILGFFLLLLPFMICVFYLALPFVTDSWQILEGSSDAGGLQFVYIFKTLILGFCITLLAQGVAEVLRATAQIMKGNR